MRKVAPKFYVFGGLALTAGLFSWYYSSPGELDDFALCLNEKGATFYGAFWCPHCKQQKAAFGKSSGKIPYVECSTPDGQRQTTACEEANIRSYPTWEFADGERLTGPQTLTTLADKTGCNLPA